MKLMNNPVRINKYVKIGRFKYQPESKKKYSKQGKIGITETAKTFLIGNNYIE